MAVTVWAVRPSRAMAAKRPGRAPRVESGRAPSTDTPAFPLAALPSSSCPPIRRMLRRFAAKRGVQRNAAPA